MPALFAHRGSHHGLPENTLAAFARALEEGADGVELDVRTCASGTVVVAHDPDLRRVAGRPERVARMGWPALARVDLGAEERVPRLDDALDLILGAGRRVNVEVKGDVPDRRRTAALVSQLLRRRRPDERAAVVLSTFDPVVLAALRWGVPEVPVGFLFDAAHTGLRRAALVRAGLRPAGVHPHAPLCTPGRVRRWRRAGLFVNVWTVNAPAEARALATLGVDALITDDVPALRRAGLDP
ncbi:MAG TPA: glycerophosphodiester phosphodiesterase [Sandaracinaceae bacterium LLY-WYZ-13_1]|nr:glycerophosphodiester phosphodiesterase [Sandaracinaceae bacterium LLY-WYZ-13_1]